MLSIIIHSIGISAISWGVLNVLSVLEMLDDPAVKYLNAKITLYPRFFIPFPFIIFYILWLLS